MLERTGNLWTAQGVICVPTNGYLDYRDHLLLSGDVAREARRKWPSLVIEAGKLVKLYGNIPFYFREQSMLTFPVKKHFRDPPSLVVIGYSAMVARTIADRYNLVVNLPRVGAGPGELPWEEVKPVLERYLDDRFTVFHEEN